MILADHLWESHGPMITSLASSDGIIFKAIRILMILWSHH
jgi:hypothetical protein